MKILVFGESTAFGACATKIEYKWCNVVAANLRDFVTGELILENKGLPGDTLEGALVRCGDDVVSQQPDLFVAAYGLNDLRAGRKPGRILDDYAELLERVRNETKVRGVVLVSVFPMREDAWKEWAPYDRGKPVDRTEYNRRLRRFTAEQGAILADVEPPAEAIPRLIHPDGVHPNNLGHRFIGNRVTNTMLTAPELKDLWVYDHSYESVKNYGKQTTRYA
jgi:lysophospholipase L1-like esterase